MRWTLTSHKNANLVSVDSRKPPCVQQMAAETASEAFLQTLHAYTLHPLGGWIDFVE
jgi:hypothetical protein